MSKTEESEIQSSILWLKKVNWFSFNVLEPEYPEDEESRELIEQKAKAWTIQQRN